MESKFYTTASMLANLKIAELESMEEVTDDDGEFGEDFPNYKYSIEVKDIDPGESELLDELHSALQKIVLLVSMGENDVFSYQISFYKRSKEGDEIFSDFRK